MNEQAHEHIRFLLTADRETVHRWCDEAEDYELLHVLQGLYQYTVQLSLTIDKIIEKKLRTERWTESAEIIQKIMNKQ